MNDSITVITLTRQRPDLLSRAIASTQRQDYSGVIKHSIIIDECPLTLQSLSTGETLPLAVEWRFMFRGTGERSGPARVAKLRNYALRLADTRWIAFLDDDNEYETNHLSSLIDCARRTGCRAVHSHMQIFWRDGRPYLETRMPWWRDAAEGAQLYTELCRKGVFQPGSNIVKDRADPLDCVNPARTVDMGEWVFERTLLLEYPFETAYSAEDWHNGTSEDDKLMEALINGCVPIACSELPTLKYYLGGYSNSFDSGPFARESDCESANP